jgi:hypothetical protein
MQRVGFDRKESGDSLEPSGVWFLASAREILRLRENVCNRTDGYLLAINPETPNAHGQPISGLMAGNLGNGR